MRCPVPPRIPDRRGEEPFPLKHTTAPFFFSLSFLSHSYFPFSFLGYGWYWGRSGDIRALPYTGGLATPWQRHQTPSPPSTWLFLYFLEWSRVTVIKIYYGPVRKDPSLLVRGDGGFWVVCFLESPCSSPVGGLALASIASVADLFPAARQAGGERESRWRTATIFGVSGVANSPLPFPPPQSPDPFTAILGYKTE